MYELGVRLRQFGFHGHSDRTKTGKMAMETEFIDAWVTRLKLLGRADQKNAPFNSFYGEGTP